jgi:hypothetical protein
MVRSRKRYKFLNLVTGEIEDEVPDISDDDNDGDDTSQYSQTSQATGKCFRLI